MTTVYCQNCTWSGAENQTAFLRDVFERVPPGTIMPWGECPECGCACYPRDEPTPPRDPPMTPVCGTCGSSDMAVLNIDIQWDHDHQLWASLRQPLIRSMLEGLHTTIHGPAGLSEQAYALTIQVENLDRGQDGTEIPMTEHYNKHHQLRELNQNIEHAENLLARLAEKHEQETGEEWQPPAPEGTTRQDQRRTGAMTEAIKTTEQIYDRYHQARLTPGTPVALTSLADCADKATVFDMLNAVKTKYPDIFLIHGASDASSITAATEWAKKNKIHQVVFKPEWKKYPGRAVVQRDHDMIATQPRSVLDFTTSDKTTALADLAVQHDIKIMPAPKPAHREDQAENRAIERDAEIERSRTADHQQDRSQANDQGMSM